MFDLLTLVACPVAKVTVPRSTSYLLRFRLLPSLRPFLFADMQLLVRLVSV